MERSKGRVQFCKANDGKWTRQADSFNGAVGKVRE